MRIDVSLELTERHGFIVVFLSLLVFFILNAMAYPHSWLQIATNIAVGMLLAYGFAWLWRAAMYYYSNEEFDGIGITARRVIMIVVALICLGGAAYFLLLFVGMVAPMFFDLQRVYVILVVIPLLLAIILIFIAAWLGLQFRTEAENQEQGAI